MKTRLNSGLKYAFAGAALAALLGGCGSSPPKPYESSAPLNVHIKTAQLKSDNVNLATTFTARIGIASVDGNCARHYQGTVMLESGKEVDIGLPAGSTSALVVVFANDSSLVSVTATSSGYKTLFTPRPGRQYDMEVSYESGRYSVNIWERGAKGGARREVEHRSFSSCVKSSG